MKRFFVLLTAMLFLLVASPALAQLPPVAPALSKAMATLHTQKDDPGLLVLTNAPFAKTDGQCSLPILATVQEATGVAVGKGNLLFFQRPQDHPLRILLFKKETRSAVILSAQGTTWATDTLNLAKDAIESPDFWKTARDKYAAGPDLFSLVTITNAWSVSAPYDFLKAAEIHNHICPGLTSGYMMARFILNHYPLEKGQRYTIISSPVWCKEDAFLSVMDLTPGKSGIVVKPLSEAQKKEITVPHPAGLLLIWDNKAQKGKGVALGFNFDTLQALYPKETPKAATILYTAPYLTQPDRFVTVTREFDLTLDQYNAMREAGSNPYQVAGLTKP